MDEECHLSLVSVLREEFASVIIEPSPFDVRQDHRVLYTILHVLLCPLLVYTSPKHVTKNMCKKVLMIF